MTIGRRDFLKVIGAVSGAAASQRCSPAPIETLIPYLVPPENIVPGEASFIATTCRECPAGCGMLAKTVDGRVIKVEGNPRHPVNAGALCARGQASIQSLYDPDRLRGPLTRGRDGQLRAITWDEGEARLAAALRDARARGRNRVAWVGRLETGSLERLVRDWLALFDSDRRLFFETFDFEPLRRASGIVVGRPEIPRYRFDRANFVLSFGADFLETWLSNVEFMREYAALRRRRAAGGEASFVMAAPRLSLTGLNADEWMPVKPGGETALALAIAHAIVAEDLLDARLRPHLPWMRSALASFAPEAVQSLTDVRPDDVRLLARQFVSATPSLAVGGGASARDARADALEIAVLLLNAVAGNLDRTVTFGGASALDALATPGDMRSLAAAMARGEIDVLLIHHANPAYTRPSGDLEAALAHVPLIVSFASSPDETTAHAHLILPDHHSLESWGDYAPREGVEGLLQPAMTPILETRATGDVLLRVARGVDGGPPPALSVDSCASYVAASWGQSNPADEGWTTALKSGGRFSEADEIPVTIRDFRAVIPSVSEPAVAAAGLTLIAFPSPFMYDGRSANCSWLQEIPDPVSHTVWNGWIEIHPDTAHRLGLAQDDLVTVQTAHGRATAAVRVYEGVRPDLVAMPIGYGRTAGLRHAENRGARVAELLPPDGASWRTDGVSLSRVGGRRLIVLQSTTEPSTSRPALAQTSTASAPTEGHEKEPPPADLYPPHAHLQHRWGMAIDLNACTGCSACVAACYSENNIPVVGERACAEGREMSWIRIERYDAPRAQRGGRRRFESVFLPMLCQQCDEAPCEAVCPVYATYHNPEGLNAQVYVRCIGTRFCSNNCPYKVRRFNWARPSWPAPHQMALNPDVTVRSAGVMEKCSFCVQRIHAGKNAAAREARTLRDGDIVPACAQTCPADAIVFGDLHDPSSRVARLAQDSRGYHVLEELNTRPAITYLKRIMPESKG
ncbi:MAG TPA: molybdopterin-dependent oxidoreductase [Vicinamibacterales bacterium]|nr:molybdopterin-dependent oxidoreductase [Vicinamibacterales bacterium]